MSIVPGPYGLNLSRAPRTPGPLGHNDAASPDTAPWFLGDTPGSLGRNDYADPDISRKVFLLNYSLTPLQLLPNVARARTQGKKFATPQEVQGIQALIDQANVVEQAAAKMEREAKSLRQAKDAHAANKERDAHAKRLEVGGLRQRAINLAVAAYGIDIYHAKSLLYDDSLTDSGEEDEGNITIGKSAFTSPGELGSTIAHEAEVHVNRQYRKGKDYSGPQGRSLIEVEAYDWEIVNAQRFGLTKDEVAGVWRLRAIYLRSLNPKYLQRRQRGDYTLEKGDEDEIPTGTVRQP